MSSYSQLLVLTTMSILLWVELVAYPPNHLNKVTLDEQWVFELCLLKYSNESIFKWVMTWVTLMVLTWCLPGFELCVAHTLYSPTRWVTCDYSWRDLSFHLSVSAASFSETRSPYRGWMPWILALHHSLNQDNTNLS